MNKSAHRIDNNWLNTASRVLSPNRNERPGESSLGLIIVHNISLPPNQFGGGHIDQLFSNRLNPKEHPYFETIHNLKVSSHLLIKRNGEITQYVPFNQRAWHAGKSTYKGKENCNDFSIGIELEGADHIPYTAEQYKQLALCCQVIMQAYPAIGLSDIVGHNDVSPGRKTDPGESFEWPLFRSLMDTQKDKN